jgi:chromosome partitioning protein
VALYDPRSRGTEAYFELTGEFLARNQMESPRAAERKALGPVRTHGRMTFWPYS